MNQPNGHDSGPQEEPREVTLRDTALGVIQICQECGGRKDMVGNQVVCRECHHVGFGHLYVSWNDIPVILAKFGVEVDAQVFEHPPPGGDTPSDPQ